MVFAIAGILATPGQADSEDDVATHEENLFELEWKKDFGRAIIFPLLPVRSGIIVTTTDKKVYRVDLENGETLWKRRFKEDIGVAPARARLESGEELLFVYLARGTRGELWALDAKDGDEIWKRQLPFRPASLHWAENALWILDLSGELSRLDPEDGRSTWSRDGFGWDPPALVGKGEQLFVLSREDSLHSFSTLPSFNEEDELVVDLLWSCHVAGRFTGPPLLHRNEVVVTSLGGGASTLHHETGQLLREEMRYRGQKFAALRADSSFLTVSADGHLQSGDGDPVDLDSAVAAQPVRIDEWVLVPTFRGDLLVVDGVSGTQVGSLSLEHPVRVAPLWTSGKLVLATNRGDIHVYHRP